MSARSTVARVLDFYPVAVAGNIEALGGAGGFSGAALWKVDADAGPLCLRRWPREHPTNHQLQSIHDILDHVTTHGFAKLPAPFRSRDGRSFVSSGGHYWELARWLPGHADFHKQPTSERLDAALVALAQFHRAAESFESQIGIPPGIVSRCEQLERLAAGGAQSMSDAVTSVVWPEFQQRATAILHYFAEQASRVKPFLAMASQFHVALQPCIRDVWHDHVLFERDEVSGFVDFGAMRRDHVACDISRLLGSLVGDDRDQWKRGLAAYQSWRPLSADELVLVKAYDRSTVLLSGMNWVQWIAVEGRQFDDRSRVLKRMDEIIQRLHKQ